jgi:hypothetical protein
MLRRVPSPRSVAAALQTRLGRPEVLLFLTALGVYAFTRFYRIADYPMYFFSDEAVQTVDAADLVRSNFRDHWGTLLPTYFENEFFLNLSLSVYLQVPFLIFGRSVAVTHRFRSGHGRRGGGGGSFLRRAFACACGPPS